MKWLAVICFATLGCSSLTEVDVGAGDIPQIFIETDYRGLPAAGSGTAVEIHTDPKGTLVSATRETPFLSDGDAAVLKNRLGDHAAAVDGIKLQVLELSIDDPDSGELLDPSVSSSAVLDGARLGGDGWVGRINLTEQRKNAVLAQVQRMEAVTLPVGIDLTISLGGAVLPSQARVQMVIQPILVVQALEAL